MSSPTPVRKATLRLVIHGRVQGVFFRESMRREAVNLEIAGWVKNRSDGKVETVVHGEPEILDLFVKWAHRGPELAFVERVEIEPCDGNFTDFEIIRHDENNS
jgi:acylphosphatase